MSDTVIGIDLGTTNSCAATYENGKLKILNSVEGHRVIPSVVYFPKNKDPPIAGSYAKKMSLVNPEYAVSESKRIIGRRKNEPYVEEHLKYFPFKMEYQNEEPIILIDRDEVVTKASPESIATLILLKIKNDVEAGLGHEINKAVITVPAYFNVSQREATLKAAEKAGFQVLKLLNEPTAAALSYYHHKKSNKIAYAEKHYSLVYDLGGGTFDVAILQKYDEHIEVICVDGDSYLGGHDFDKKIFEFVCEEVDNLCNFKIQNGRRIIRRVLNLCEEAKKELSTPDVTEADINLDVSLVPRNEMTNVTLTQEQFETMIEPYIQKTIQIVENCLNTAKISKNDIAEIILAGGSTRIPKIQERLSQFFHNKHLNKYVNPDECVAEGAAIQAAVLSKNPKQQIQYMRISEVIPLSLGTSNYCNKMSVIIPRNSKIPITKSKIFLNCYDEQKAISFEIYEGERLNVNKNRYLANLIIDNLTPAAPRECEVDLKLSIDHNGILTATAQEKYKNNIKDLKITHTRVVNNKSNDIKHEIQSNKEYEEEDRKFESFASRKAYLIDYCVNLCYQMKQKSLISKYKYLYEMCRKAQMEVVDLDVEEEKELKELIKKITNSCDEIVASNNITSMPTVPVEVLNEHPVEQQHRSRGHLIEETVEAPYQNP